MVLKVSRKYYLKIIIFSFLLFANFSGQENNLIISGFVRDNSTGEILIGSTILLYKDSVDANNINLVKLSSTNQYGFYAIPKVDVGNYFIVARNIGYKIFFQKISITKSTGRFQFDIQMISEDIELSEIVVKGEKGNEVKASTIDIHPDLIKNLPSLTGEVSLFKSLQMIPGIKAATEISSGLYIRGGSPDQTLTLVDGIVIYNPTHLGNISSTFNTNALQSIRLIKGAFPAEYGGRLSSVLDIKLRNGTKEKDKGIFGFGSINSHALLEGPLTKNSTYMISGRKMYYDAMQKTLNKNSLVPRYNFHDFNTKFSYRINENEFLTLSSIFSEDNVYSPPKVEDINYEIQWQNAAVSLNWLQVNPHSNFSNTSISYIRYQFKSLIDDIGTSTSSSDYFALSKLQDVIIKRNNEFFHNENIVSKVGIELTLHKYELTYSNLYSTVVENDPNLINEFYSSEASIYYQNEWQISSRLKTNLGGRFYYFHDMKSLRLEPRASFAFAIDDELSFKGAYSIAHQYLNLITRNDVSLPTDLWYPSTSKLAPSKSAQYVAGFEKFIKNDYQFSVEGYYKFLNNIFEFKNIPEIGDQGNIEDLFTTGKGEAYGIEAFANKLSGNFTGWIGYTYSWTRRQFPELNAGMIYYPKYDRRHDISIALSYNVNQNFKLGLTWVYATGQGIILPVGQYQFKGNYSGTGKEIKFNYTQRSEYKMPAYHRMDINLAYNFIWRKLNIETYFGIYNLYNRQNPFAQYVSIDKEKRIPKLVQLSLFPLIPVFGFNVSFKNEKNIIEFINQYFQK